ncbi:hypothetical protein B9G55_21610 [Saccharibacillus sp. O16]|nr:hypothetical protein B9G55_21610 [Saccharibacillus sp. O16]
MRRSTLWVLVLVLSAVVAAGLHVWSPWSSGKPALTLAEAESKLLKQYTGKIESSRQDGALYEMKLRMDAGLYQIRLSASDGQVESIERLESAPVPPPEIVSREVVKRQLEDLEGFRVQRLELDTTNSGATRLYVAEVTGKSGERRSLEIDAYSGKILVNRLVEPQDSGETTVPNEGKPGGAPEGVPGGGKPTDPTKEPSGQGQARLLSEEEAKQAAAVALNVEAAAVEDTDVELRSQEDGQAYYLVDIELKNGREAEVQINAVSGAMQTITWDEEKSED